MIDKNKVKPSDLWYIIGFIAADGSLSIDGRHINITSKDYQHLYAIREVLQLKNTIGKKYRSKEKKQVYSQLQIGDTTFYKYLVEIGFSPNKSLTLGQININSTFFIDFLRGVIDGDGNISTWIHRTNLNRQWCLRIYSASESFLIWLNSPIHLYFKFESKIYIYLPKNRQNPVFILKFGKKNAAILLKILYYPNCLSLKRKMIQAQLCLQEAYKVLN